jgi:hypothetical protein
MGERASSWGRDFDPDRLARLELAMWKAYYRREAGLLFRLLVRANQAQARVGWLLSLIHNTEPTRPEPIA